MSANSAPDYEKAISAIKQHFKDAKQEIIETLKQKRLYDIVGNDRVFLDISTGLLWGDFYYMPNKRFTISEGKSEVKVIDFDFEGFRLPKITELKQLVGSGYLDKQNPREAFLTDTEIKVLSDFKMSSRYVNISFLSSPKVGYLMPCSDVLLDKAKIDKKEYFDTMKKEPYKGYKLAYTLITKNQLKIKFNDPALDMIIMDYYDKLPMLQNKLKETNTKETGKPENEFEYLEYDKIISSYDVSAINASLYDYSVNAEKLCTSLRNKIITFDSKNAELIEDIDKCNAFFKEEYKSIDALTDEENALFKNAYDIIRGYYDIGLDSKKELLKKNAKEFRELQKRMVDAAVSEDNIAELGRIEAEPRPSFTLYTQMMVDAVNNSYAKISMFVNKREVITCLADAYISRYELYIDSVTKWLSQFIKENEKGRIPRDIAEKWTDDLRYELREQLRVFVDMVEHFLSVNPMNMIIKGIDFVKDAYQKIKDNGINKGIGKTINNMIGNLSCKDLCDILSNHTAAIRDFYTNKRKDIYIRNAISANGNKRLLLDKLDTEKELYEVSGDLRRSICELLNSTSENDSKFIANCFGNLCNIPLIELSSLEINSEIKHISSETYKKLDELRKNTYELLLSDAKLYAAEQEKREAEINALFYEMSLDLEK